MGRITEIGSFIASPNKELQKRGKKLLQDAVTRYGSFVVAAEKLGVSDRTMFRWAAKLGLRSPKS